MLAGFFKKSIPQFASLTNEMEEAKHSPEIEWTLTMDIAFLQVKEAFERGPVRAFPYLNPGSKPLVVTPELFGNSIGPSWSKGSAESSS